jgi:hypothetical protein
MSIITNAGQAEAQSYIDQRLALLNDKLHEANATFNRLAAGHLKWVSTPPSNEVAKGTPSVPEPQHSDEALKISAAISLVDDLVKNMLDWNDRLEI